MPLIYRPTDNMLVFRHKSVLSFIVTMCYLYHQCHIKSSHNKDHLLKINIFPCFPINLSEQLNVAVNKSHYTSKYREEF